VSRITGIWLVRSSVFNRYSSAIPSSSGIITSLTITSGTWSRACSQPKRLFEAYST
jgi:hypothetical protein